MIISTSITIIIQSVTNFSGRGIGGDASVPISVDARLCAGAAGTRLTGAADLCLSRQTKYRNTAAANFFSGNRCAIGNIGVLTSGDGVAGIVGAIVMVIANKSCSCLASSALAFFLSVTNLAVGARGVVREVGSNTLYGVVGTLIGSSHAESLARVASGIDAGIGDSRTGSIGAPIANGAIVVIIAK